MNPPDRETVGVVVATAVGYATLALVVDTVPAPGTVSLAAGVTLPLALLLGPAVGWGVAVGVLATALLRGSLAPATLVVAGAVVLLATLGTRLWGAVPRLASGSHPTEFSLRATLEYVVLAVVPAAAAAATLGWGFELLGAAPFHLVAVPTFLSLAAASLLAGPLVLLPAGRYGADATGRGPAAAGRRRPSRAAALGALLAPVWLLGGVVASLGFRVGQSLPPGAFTSRGLEALLVVLDPALVGRGGRRVQVALGALGLVLVTWLATRERPASAVAHETTAGAEAESTTPRGVTDR